jgi:hypothetical protein
VPVSAQSPVVNAQQRLVRVPALPVHISIHVTHAGNVTDVTNYQLDYESRQNV